MEAALCNIRNTSIQVVIGVSVSVVLFLVGLLQRFMILTALAWLFLALAQCVNAKYIHINIRKGVKTKPTQAHSQQINHQIEEGSVVDGFQTTRVLQDVE